MQKFKIKKYIKPFIILSAVIISFASCLKETNSPPLYGRNTSNVVSFQDNGGSDGSGAAYASYPTTPYPLYNFSFNLENDTAGFDALVIYGPGPAPQDIKVDLSVDKNALKDFNKENGTGYVIPDQSVYNLPSSIVIKKGESQASAHIVITATSSYDFSASYALPLTIMSASGATISSNFKTEINSFLIKNEWDGDYAIHVEISGPNAYTGTVFDDNTTLHTSGGNSVSEGDIADFFGGYTNYTFNSDGTVDVFAGTGANTGSYGAVVNESSYDESTHNFHVNYSILGGKYIFDLTYTQ